MNYSEGDGGDRSIAALFDLRDAGMNVLSRETDLFGGISGIGSIGPSTGRPAARPGAKAHSFKTAELSHQLFEVVARHYLPDLDVDPERLHPRVLSQIILM